MWDCPRTGIEPTFPALASGFSSTVPLGKSPPGTSNIQILLACALVYGSPLPLGCEAPGVWGLACLAHLVFPAPKTASGTQEMPNPRCTGRTEGGWAREAHLSAKPWQASHPVPDPGMQRFPKPGSGRSQALSRKSFLTELPKFTV